MKLLSSTLLLTSLFTTLVSAGGYINSCDIPTTTFSTSTQKEFFIHTTCKNKAGGSVKTKLDLSKCIANSGGKLVRRKNGGFSASCKSAYINHGTTLSAACYKGSHTGPLQSSEININAFITNHNGVISCDN